MNIELFAFAFFSGAVSGIVLVILFFGRFDNEGEE